MLQLVILAGCFAMGLGLSMAGGYRRDPVLATALAMPLGMALAALLAATFVLLQIQITFLAYGTAFTLVLAAVWRAGWRASRSLAERPPWRPAVLVLAVLVAIVVVAWWRDLTLLDMRGHDLLLVTSSIARNGWLTPAAQLPEETWVSLGVHLHAPFFLVAPRFHHLVYPVLGLSALLMAGVLLARGVPGTGRGRMAVVATAGLVLATSPALLHALASVSSPAVSGVMLLAFAGVWLHGEANGEPRAVPIALVPLAAFALEDPALATIAGPCLVLAALGSSFPRRALTSWIASFLFLDTALLLPGAVAALLAPAGAGLVWVIHGHPALGRTARHTSLAVAAGAALALAVGVLAGPDEVAAAADSLCHQVLYRGWWPLAAATAVAAGVALRRGWRPIEGRFCAAAFLSLTAPLLLEQGGSAAHSALTGLATSLPLLFFVLVTAAAGRVPVPRAVERSTASTARHVSRRGLQVVATTLWAGLFGLALLANLRQLGENQSLLGRNQRIAIHPDVADLRALAEGGTQHVREWQPLVYLARARTQGATVFLSGEYIELAAYLERIARNHVHLQTERLVLPAAAAERLEKRADDTVTLRGSTHVAPLFLIFSPENEYVLAESDAEGKPSFWLPVSVFLEEGGLGLEREAVR